MTSSIGKAVEKAKREVVRLWSYFWRSRRFANRDGNLLHTNYIIPRSQGGSNWDKNLELLHLHCHDGKKTESKQSES
ncbi:HNH endonuclease [Moorena sp. SIO4A1]|uniref:HNH endonuclease n=1 Tax=Moorena sp. SIO4A1 TaxID=2607835 RepID=UPI0025D56913|nr:HNH endonuclease [Moorena sp. SIO4A1]